MESDDSLAVALFDYSNNNFSIQKGDLLSILEEKPNAKLWKVRSLDGKNSSVPHALVSRIPSMTDNIVNPVVALSDFDATKNFLSFKSGDVLNIIQKTTEDTWLARSSTSNNIGYIPSFMVADTHEVGDMYLVNHEKIFTTLRDSEPGPHQDVKFLSYTKGTKLAIISGKPEGRVWYGRTLLSNQRGYIPTSDVIDQCDFRINVHQVDVDDARYMKCGDQCVLWKTPCVCGNTQMDGFSLQEYCCVAPTDSCSVIPYHSLTGFVAICPKGQVLPVSQPCHNMCYNDYERSQSMM